MLLAAGQEEHLDETSKVTFAMGQHSLLSIVDFSSYHCGNLVCKVSCVLPIIISSLFIIL